MPPDADGNQVAQEDGSEADLLRPALGEIVGERVDDRVVGLVVVGRVAVIIVPDGAGVIRDVRRDDVVAPKHVLGVRVVR